MVSVCPSRHAMGLSTRDDDRGQGGGSSGGEIGPLQETSGEKCKEERERMKKSHNGGGRSPYSENIHTVAHPCVVVA